MSNFRIGQEVVCIDAAGTQTQTGRHSGLVQGGIYKIGGLTTISCCQTYGIVDVGIYDTSEIMRCSYCGRIHYMGNIWWFRSDRFRPLLTDSEEADFQEAISEPEYA